MIAPKNNKVIHWFFHRYILRLIDKNFRSFNFNHIEVDQDKSVLLIPNHFSWWDGFMLYYLNHKLFKKRFHIMILEETVSKVFFLKYMGAFSISKNSKSLIESLNYAAELLNDPQNLVVIFPQGKLYSNFVQQVEFDKGVLRVMDKAKQTSQLVFAATFIEYFEYKKPGINVYLNKSTVNSFNNINQFTDAYQQHYNAARHQQTQIVI
ncbi:lysophospholipid acyltransferase family protein [Mucilaginibacter sp. JRF]|uniref:lysophospholipid acyltransferase family protein n=1 Tax=Mucilaginibacter sp. JRF TaxID=2780088 RepID=UPI001882DC26|nr:lysophospholipid acyltransferase family protein [Mucilaginibacter sp. JRF]MBE9585729.1 lysophospholipid acyltransferase family protein [Mucilaginibacter sp. JRF]